MKNEKEKFELNDKELAEVNGGILLNKIEFTKELSLKNESSLLSLFFGYFLFLVKRK